MSSQPHPDRTGSPFRPWATFLLCLVALLLLGWLDYRTGYELSLVVFYSGPVGLAAWHAGRWPGLLLAIIAALACSLADKYDGLSYSSRFFFFWNLGIHFEVFAVNAVAADRIRAVREERDRLAREVRRLQRENSQPLSPSLTAE